MDEIFDLTNTKPRERLLIIDGSAFVFIHASKPNFKETMHLHLRKFFELYNTRNYIIYLEKSSSNFRRHIDPTYKAQRQVNREKYNLDQYIPYLQDCIDHLNNQYGAITCIGVENDDMIRIAANKFKMQYDVVIIGDDSDLLCIEGLHYRIKSNTELSVNSELGEIYINDKSKLFATGLYNTYAKIIMGSTKENYPGLKGYGVRKVYEILKNAKTESELLQITIYHFYKQFGDDATTKLEHAYKLCYLLKDNINFKLPRICQFLIN